MPIAQRKRDYEPQTKLLEFLAAILSGCRYLQDISLCDTSLRLAGRLILRPLGGEASARGRYQESNDSSSRSAATFMMP